MPLRLLHWGACSLLSWSQVPQDRPFLLLPSLDSLNTAGFTCSHFVWAICKVYNQIIILWIWKFIYECQGSQILNLSSFSKMLLEFCFCCRYCKYLLSAIIFILITKLLKQWKHACENSLCIQNNLSNSSIWKLCIILVFRKSLCWFCCHLQWEHWIWCSVRHPSSPSSVSF